MLENHKTKFFGVEGVREYLQVASIAVERFSDKPSDIVLGFSAILLLNHIPDWLSKESTEFKLNAGLGTDFSTIKTNAEVICPDVKLIRDVSNGIKHLRQSAPDTSLVSGYGNGPYGVGPYGKPYLLISDSSTVVSLSMTVKTTLEFWKEQLEVSD